MRCKCHGERMDWVVDHYSCAVKRRARQLAYYHRRKHDPDYMFGRRVRESCRIRVR